MKLQNIKLKMLSNFISSIKGWKIYHKIVHKYPLKRGLYILIPEMDEKLSFCAAAFCTLWRSQMRFRAVALRSITAARF